MKYGTSRNTNFLTKTYFVYRGDDHIWLQNFKEVMLKKWWFTDIKYGHLQPKNPHVCLTIAKSP